MAATVTLATTTFAAPVNASDSQVVLSSTSGITPGVRLFCGQELLAVIGLTGISTTAVVRRGVDGTQTARHSTADTVWIGRADQFYYDDPDGTPPPEPIVSPYINVMSGVVWVVQGDDAGPGKAAQTWRPITTAQSAGALGVRLDTTTTPS